MCGTVTYRIAGNFRGRKLSQIGEKDNFWGEKFHKLLACATQKDTTPPNFVEKTFTNSHKTAKFVKVFSLKSFPLYSMRATWGTHQYTVTMCKPKQLFSDSLSGSLFFLSGETVLRVLGHKGGHLLRQLLWNGAKVAVGPEMGIHWIRAPGELLAQTKQTKSGAKSAKTTEIRQLSLPFPSPHVSKVVGLMVVWSLFNSPPLPSWYQLHETP